MSSKAVYYVPLEPLWQCFVESGGLSSHIGQDLAVASGTENINVTVGEFTCVIGNQQRPAYGRYDSGNPIALPSIPPARSFAELV